jgi:hypothetical protein
MIRTAQEMGRELALLGRQPVVLGGKVKSDWPMLFQVWRSIPLRAPPCSALALNEGAQLGALLAGHGHGVTILVEFQGR